MRPAADKYVGQSQSQFLFLLVTTYDTILFYHDTHSFRRRLFIRALD